MHQSTLQCPCSKIAVSYEQFIQIEPFYHELCQSDFISNDWINHLFSLYEQSWNNSISSDFRRIAVFQFQTIRSLCQLAKETKKNELQSFQKKEFIQSQLVLPELFRVQINSFIAEFINSTPEMFFENITVYTKHNSAKFIDDRCFFNQRSTEQSIEYIICRHEELLLLEWYTHFQTILLVRAQVQLLLAAWVLQHFKVILFLDFRQVAI